MYSIPTVKTMALFKKHNKLKGILLKANKTILLLTILCSACLSYAENANLDENYTMTRKEWLHTNISNYLSGFNRYDHSLLIIDQQIRVAIYISNDNNKKDAEALLNRWKNQIEQIKNHYTWASKLEIITNVYNEFSEATKR